MKIPLMKPYIPRKSYHQITQVLESGWLTEGDRVKVFEKMINDTLGWEGCVAVPNATQGLEFVLWALGIGTGDAVAVPNFTHPATALAVQNVQAKVVLWDVDEHSWNLQKPPESDDVFVDAVVPVSQFGNPVLYETLYDSVKSKGHYTKTIFIEDAACSLGSARSVNYLPEALVFSFHPRKIVTTGEGGMIASNNSELLKALRVYKNFGEKTLSGFNYKMSDLNAALVIPQLASLTEITARRNEIVRLYREGLAGLCTFQEILIYSNCQTFCIRTEARDELRSYLADKGIESQIGSYALNTLPQFKEAIIPEPMPVSEALAKETLALPVYHTMLEDNSVEYIIEHIRKFFRRRNG